MSDTIGINQPNEIKSNIINNKSKFEIIWDNFIKHIKHSGLSYHFITEEDINTTKKTLKLIYVLSKGNHNIFNNDLLELKNRIKEKGNCINE